MISRKLLVGSVAMGALALAAPGVASAQASAPAATADDGVRVETVVVTARKKEEQLLNAPVAVTAVGAADISRLGVQSVDDLARFTPGLSFSKAFGRSSDRPVLRGAANILATVQAGVESGTAFFVDGVYYQGDIQSLDPNEIARIEVIKGPQSALYGRNTYAGAINYITRDPASAFEANAMLSAAEHDEINASARIAGPITEWMSGSLSGRYYTFGGEWANSAVPGETLGEEESRSISGVLDIRPIEGLSIRARLSYAEDDDGPRAFGFQGSNANNCFPGYRSNAFRGSSAVTNNNPNQYFCGVIRDSGVYFQNTTTLPTATNVVTGPNGGIFNWTGIAGSPYMGVAREVLFGSITADVDLPDGHSVTIQTGFRDETRRTGSDSDFQTLTQVIPGPLGGVVGGQPRVNGLFQLAGLSDTQDLSLEVRVASPLDRRLRWLVGLYLYQLDTEGTPFNFAFNNPPEFRGPVTTYDGTSNAGVFGRLSFDVTERLSVDVEARQQTESKTTREFGDGLSAARPLNRVLYEDKRSFDAFTPRVTVNWQPMDGTTVYGIYAQGAKPGGLNGNIGLLNNRPIYEQEESTNYELGLKTRLWDGRGQLQLAAYRTEASKYQLTTTIADNTGASATGLTSVVTNQGDAEIQGFEGDFRFRLTRNLGFAFNFSHVKTEFTTGCDDTEYVLRSGGFLMSPVCDVPVRTTPVVIAGGLAAPIAGASGSIVGRRIPLVPENQASFNVDYSRPIGAGGWEIFASADVSYESSKFVQVHNQAETGDTTLVGARVGVGNDNWRLSLYGRNLTDEDSIPIATRWFDLFQGSAAAAGIPAAQQVGLDTGSPRGFFYSPRKGRQVGVELKWTY